MLSNDAAGVCICDVNSAVAASPDRPGATPPRTLSDYFTVNSPRANACFGTAAAPFYARRILVQHHTGVWFSPFFKGDNHGADIAREYCEKLDKVPRRYSRPLNILVLGNIR